MLCAVPWDTQQKSVVPTATPATCPLSPRAVSPSCAALLAEDLAVLLQVGNREGVGGEDPLSAALSLSQLHSGAAFWPLVSWFGVFCAYSKSSN